MKIASAVVNCADRQIHDEDTHSHRDKLKRSHQGSPLQSDEVDPPAPAIPRSTNGDAFGLSEVLRHGRQSLALSQRQVEVRSGGFVSHSHLSRIENGAVKRPSQIVLFHLAEIYRLDFGTLLSQSGYSVAERRSGIVAYVEALADLPVSALRELDSQERKRLTACINSILREREPRVAGTGRTTSSPGC